MLSMLNYSLEGHDLGKVKSFVAVSNVGDEATDINILLTKFYLLEVSGDF